MFAFSHSKTAISVNILLVLQILCRYKWCACRLASIDKFPTVPTKIWKSIIGGGGGNCPRPPSGYASEYVNSKTEIFGNVLILEHFLPHCRNGYSYRTTLLLSIFLGMLGVDRIYLGYYALGLLKFCTMGLLFVGHFVDVILIATQVHFKQGATYVSITTCPLGK